MFYHRLLVEVGGVSRQGSFTTVLAMGAGELGGGVEEQIAGLMVAI